MCTIGLICYDIFDMCNANEDYAADTINHMLYYTVFYPQLNHFPQTLHPTTTLFSVIFSSQADWIISSPKGGTTSVRDNVRCLSPLIAFIEPLFPFCYPSVLPSSNPCPCPCPCPCLGTVIIVFPAVVFGTRFGPSFPNLTLGRSNL